MVKVIEAENLGKKYIISHQPQSQYRYTALRDVIADRIKSFLQMAINYKNQKSLIPRHEEFWALRNISFEVNEGDRIGIIGNNGAGKTTLLKILSRITEPTEGKVKIKGRVASLLEVGTGFHPELTGRENIFLNGAILGMTKSDIKKHFDEIVEFAEVEKFLDLPVKRYSSGMYVRLAFAIAAHLESDILLVDEVLAVGDAQFQKKCLGKMEEVSKCAGRTILFVSHNMGAISNLCKISFLIDEGLLACIGDTQYVISNYLKRNLNNYNDKMRNFFGTLNSKLSFNKILINNKSQDIVVSPSESIKIQVYGECKADIPKFRLTISLFKRGFRLLTIHDLEKPETLPKCKFKSELEIPSFFIRPGEYSIAAGGYCENGTEWMWGTDLLSFYVSEEWSNKYESVNIGAVNLFHKGNRILFL